MALEQTTLETLVARLTALETKVATLECALEDATESLDHERSVRQELEGKVDQLERQLHAALTAPSSHGRITGVAPAVSAPVVPPSLAEVSDIGKQAFRQALEYGWLLSHGDGMLDEYASPRITSRTYVKGPAPTPAELAEMRRKQALEHHWFRLHSTDARDSELHVAPASLPRFALRPAAYSSRGPVSASELRDLARRQAWEDVWAPHDGGFPYTFPLHDVA
jgi:hypothetical protein